MSERVQERSGTPGNTVRTVRHLIGGQWADASDGDTFETRDPHDGALLGVVARGTSADGEAAIATARRAFDEGPWPQITPKERADILHAVADKVDAPGKSSRS